MPPGRSQQRLPLPGAPLSRRTLLLALCLGACAGWRGEIDPRLAPGEAPETGPAVAVGPVRDLRDFRSRSFTQYTPSLHFSRRDEPGIRARTVGRRREGRGGNLLLPEGRSAAALVTEALEAGFRRAGFRVAAPGAPGAVAVEAEILGLWTWNRTRWYGRQRFESWLRVRLHADVPPFRDGGLVCGYQVLARGGPSAAVWTRALEGALADLGTDLGRRLHAPGAAHWCIGP